MTPKEMETQKYLRQVRRQWELVQNLLQERDQIDSAIHSISASSIADRVQTSPVADRIADQLATLQEKSEELAAAYNAHMDFRIHVVGLIDQLADEKQRIVLYMHYLQFVPFAEIANQQHYCYNYITAIHRAAIASFTKKHWAEIEKTMRPDQISG